MQNNKGFNPAQDWQLANENGGFSPVSLKVSSQKNNPFTLGTLFTARLKAQGKRGIKIFTLKQISVPTPCLALQILAPALVTLVTRRGSGAPAAGPTLLLALFPAAVIFSP